MTIELFISSDKIKNCNEIVDLLINLQILGNVSSNKTIIKKNNKYFLEKGCKIIIANHQNIDSKKDIEKKLWEPIQNKFNLECAYINVSNNFNGCIYDYLRKSNCPG